MAKNKKMSPAENSKALGASVMIDLKDQSDGGPLGWLKILHLVQERLVSRGGRPSDPHWDTKRLVPFRRQTWKRLMAEAAMISAHGRKVGPAQLAAILIEQRLDSREGPVKKYL